MQTSPYVANLGQLTEPGALSLWGMGQTLQSPDFHQVVGNSVIVGVATAAIGTALCFALAYTRYRTNAPGRNLLEYVAMLPLAVPAIVLGLGLLWTWLALPIPVYGTLAVLVIAFVAVFLPQGYRGVSASIIQLDKDLEDSAVMLGARRHRAITFVTAPASASRPVVDLPAAAHAVDARTDRRAVPVHLRHPAAVHRDLRRLRQRLIPIGGRAELAVLRRHRSAGRVGAPLRI